MTLSDVEWLSEIFKLMRRSIAQPVCDSWAYCFLNDEDDEDDDGSYDRQWLYRSMHRFHAVLLPGTRYTLSVLSQCTCHTLARLGKPFIRRCSTDGCGERWRDRTAVQLTRHNNWLQRLLRPQLRWLTDSTFHSVLTRQPAVLLISTEERGHHCCVRRGHAQTSTFNERTFDTDASHDSLWMRIVHFYTLLLLPTKEEVNVFAGVCLFVSP